MPVNPAMPAAIYTISGGRYERRISRPNSRTLRSNQYHRRWRHVAFRSMLDRSLSWVLLVIGIQRVQRGSDIIISFAITRFDQIRFPGKPDTSSLSNLTLFDCRSLDSKEIAMLQWPRMHSGDVSCHVIQGQIYSKRRHHGYNDALSPVKYVQKAKKCLEGISSFRGDSIKS